VFKEVSNGTHFIVIINRDVPAGCTIVGAPARIVKRGGTRINERPKKHEGK